MTDRVNGVEIESPEQNQRMKRPESARYGRSRPPRSPAYAEANSALTQKFRTVLGEKNGQNEKSPVHFPNRLRLLCS